MAAEARTVPIDQASLQDLLTEKVAEVARQPEHSWADGFRSYRLDDGGEPLVRLAVANCAADMDLWDGLRSPAQVGMYPLGLRDVWMHYAVNHIRSTRADGSPNPLAMPEPFEDALPRLKRAVLISALLPLNPQIHESHAAKIERGEADPATEYCKARGEVGQVISRAVGRLALSLMAPGRVVVPMDPAGAAKVIDGTRSQYTTGRYHGPCNNHWPQNSLTVMTGLLRFGVNRIPFRDELAADGSVRRLFGQYASIVVFDDQPPITDGAGGVVLLDAERLAWLRRVNDYTDVAPDIVAQRYCTYNVTNGDGDSACGLCIEACPSGALAHSSPAPDGVVAEKLLAQKHRFANGQLDFDAGNCIRERKQKAQLYPEYVCARCAAVCAARGKSRAAGDITRINSQASTA